MSHYKVKIKKIFLNKEDYLIEKKNIFIKILIKKYFNYFLKIKLLTYDFNKVNYLLYEFYKEYFIKAYILYIKKKINFEKYKYFNLLKKKLYLLNNLKN